VELNAWVYHMGKNSFSVQSDNSFPHAADANNKFQKIAREIWTVEKRKHEANEVQSDQVTSYINNLEEEDSNKFPIITPLFRHQQLPWPDGREARPQPPPPGKYCKTIL